MFVPMKDAVNAYIGGIAGKTGASLPKLMIKAFLAGMMIAFGAAASSLAAHNVANIGLARFLSGCIFPVGLMMVVFCGAELFTGDCLMIMGVADKKTKVLDMIRVLILVWIGNLVGSLFLAWGVYVAGQFNYTGGLLGAYTIKVALGKCILAPIPAVVSGILCNILVCGAVMLALCAKDAAGKILSIFFVIMVFVTCGFEHCVANMYYIPAGLLAAGNESYVQVAMENFGYTATQLSQLNITNCIVNNLIPVTIGNIIGGMVFVGLALWYINKGE